MKEPYFDNSTQTWHQPLDSMQDISRDVMLSIVRDREGKLKKLLLGTVEAAVLVELQALVGDDLSTQQMKLIASESALRTVRDLTNLKTAVLMTNQTDPSANGVYAIDDTVLPTD